MALVAALRGASEAASSAWTNHQGPGEAELGLPVFHICAPYPRSKISASSLATIPPHQSPRAKTRRIQPATAGRDRPSHYLARTSSSTSACWAVAVGRSVHHPPAADSERPLPMTVRSPMPSLR
jgi:hypothetical protein